jgi:hypothetical protein
MKQMGAFSLANRKVWIHKDVALYRNVDEQIVRRIYAAVQIAKRQGLHGGYTVDLIERSVGRNLTVYEESVAHLAREHLNYSCPPCGYGGPKPRGSAKEPSRAIDRTKVNEARRLVSSGDAIIRDIIARRDRSTRSRKPSFSVLLKKAANILDVAVNACEQAGAALRAETLRERAKYVRRGDFDMLRYGNCDRFQEDRFLSPRRANEMGRWPWTERL